ncbi:MAG: NERD domain-containing protein, partial [Chloroflexi bacterium]|nr:NERD domain-containing protein [Chloroflexota bacterium]
MAEIYGRRGDTSGEIIVHQELVNLPNEWIIYSQPKIITDSGNRHPDYVILHPELGMIVLEIKDWVEIIDQSDDRAQVRRKKDKIIEWQTSPVKQAM